MTSDFEKVITIIEKLQTGYYTNRQTEGNERLAFLVVMLALTKHSIPHVVSIKKSQFHIGVKDCIFRGFSPRAHNLYRIHLPMSFYDYVNDYCSRYLIGSDSLLFPYNSEYVGNRLRELSKFCEYDLSSRDIQKCIPHKYNSASYQKKAFQLVNMLTPIPLLEAYICTTADTIGLSINEFIVQYLS